MRLTVPSDCLPQRTVDPPARVYAHCSNAFVELVLRRMAAEGQTPEILQGVALWCSNQPAWYQEAIWARLGLPHTELRMPASGPVESAVTRLAVELRRHHQVAAFLLDDGEPIAESFESRGGLAIRIRLGRDSFPENVRREVYLRLFSLVNESALRQGSSWRAFTSDYERRLMAMLSSHMHGAVVRQTFCNALQGVETTLSLLRSQPRRLVLVDSGVQATFLLPLMVLMESGELGWKQPCNVRLLAVYPWLAKLFQHRCQTSQVSLVTGLEHESDLRRESRLTRDSDSSRAA